MTQLTRKQREVEQRSREILRIARPILVGEGFQALSMERLASQMEYAKGTIYNHFPHKEEIVLALAVEAMELRRALFERAARMDGPTRVRLMAIGYACEFFTQTCTDDFLVEQWIRNNNIWDKSSEQRQNLIRQCEGCCMQIVSSVVLQAIENRDLVIPDAISPQEFVFGFWAINYGSQILTHSSPSLKSVGVFNPVQAIRVHCLTLLNGFQWIPMMTWQEYESRMAQIGPALESDFHAICAERDRITPSERSNTERLNTERSNTERSNKVTQ
jgi:AcrR family transcriptional regulator